jgi:hypothetical protein
MMRRSFVKQLHLLFIIRGRACKDCTALGVTAAKSVANCLLKPFLGGKRPANVKNDEAGGSGSTGKKRAAEPVATVKAKKSRQREA